MQSHRQPLVKCVAKKRRRTEETDQISRLHVANTDIIFVADGKTVRVSFWLQCIPTQYTPTGNTRIQCYWNENETTLVFDNFRTLFSCRPVHLYSSTYRLSAIGLTFVTEWLMPVLGLNVLIAFRPKRWSCDIIFIHGPRHIVTITNAAFVLNRHSLCSRYRLFNYNMNRNHPPTGKSLYSEWGTSCFQILFGFG